MAQHIDSVAGSSIPKVSKQAFLAGVKQGDLVFCSGQAALSKGIEDVTKSPFSHVLMVWRPWESSSWLTLESTDDKGVHVGMFSDYVNSYDGDLVLTRRPALTPGQIAAQLNVGFTLLDDTYDYAEEGSIVARKLLKFLPDIKPKKELYCSGLQQAVALHTIPFKTYDIDWNTPEQDYIDQSVVALAVLLKS
jgi:hypothetical protein